MLRFILLFPSVLLADEFFEQRIRPVLAEKCYGCHSAQVSEPKAGLRLDAPAPHITQKLLQAISYTDLRLRMPPTGKLPDAVIADFRAWIERGAPDPRPAVNAAPVKPGLDLARGRKFWSFQPLPATPSRDSIDRFLAAKRQAKGLATAPEASRRAWLRRVTFDLTGLPPTKAEVDAFLAGASHESVVDRLLASPHYGERWARHWLDLVRFAETNGHEYDNSKLDAWQYRDYVIRAMNDDLPFNRFVEEHVAGDLLAKPRVSADGKFLESPLATSFYWFGEVLNSATDSVKSKADGVDNQIDVLNKAFLGLTVACARCHDHKFDPVPTRDYYGLAGVLHSTGMREVVVDSPAQVAAIHAAHLQVAPVARRPGRAKIQLRPGETLWEDFDDLSRNAWHASGEAFALGPREGVVDSAGRGASELTGSLISRKFRMPNHYVHIRLNASQGNKDLAEREPVRVTLVADEYKSLHYLGKGQGKFEWVTHRMTLPYGRTCYFEIVDRSRTGQVAVDAIVFSEEKDPPPVSEEEPAVWEAPRPQPSIPPSTFGMVAWDESAQDTKLHIRGSHQNLGEPVPRHFLQVITPGQQPALTGSGRLELAQWLTHDASALLARVYVNRIWRHHFGEGLARSVDNFGLTGERPEHRELLDTLAARFIADGWSTKRLQREIVLSAAYRMSSREDPAAAKADPRNELLHHYPVRRLEAEAIRDAMLAVSGTLDRQMYGPSVTPYVSAYQIGRGKPKSGPLDGAGRRSIYIEVRRNFLTPLFLAFDYPLPISTIGARNQSTVPTQALMLMNNEFVLGEAARWAARVSGAKDPVAQMYQEAFSRPPDAREQAEAREYLRQGGTLAGFAHVLFNSPEFLYVP
ncbi:MAG: PSD1 and planctomycete cytochrome C domain-containing protein [Bryobacteraceae bacterium]|nr:PSD1 and planctomycete cytochrome C domain-containing protein [Bryobacteraceae bacterium]